jgi:hypothetical protein
MRRKISALQVLFLFFLQEKNLQKALIPFVGVCDNTELVLLCTAFFRFFPQITTANRHF